MRSIYTTAIVFISGVSICPHGTAPTATAQTKKSAQQTLLAVSDNLKDNSDDDGKSPKPKTSLESIPEIPEGITSFGAAAIGKKLFTYGGHTGEAHKYYSSGQNKKLRCLDLSDPKGEWQVVGKGVGLQGLAMASYKDQLFRVGGFEAKNRRDDDADLHSLASFAKFDFAKKSWVELTPMPEGRSSFDARVVKNRLYVVGGWTMKGKEKTVWCEDAYSIDLDKALADPKTAKWEKLPTPEFQRRAMALGVLGDELFVIGGMAKRGGPTTRVSVFNLKNKSWSNGPVIPGKGMEGFGAAAINVNGTLVVSTYGGNVYKLSHDKKSWEKIKQLELGRFFHQMLAIEGNALLIGGAHMEDGKFTNVEIVPVNSK